MTDAICFRYVLPWEGVLDIGVRFEQALQRMTDEEFSRFLDRLAAAEELSPLPYPASPAGDREKAFETQQ